jgi:anti-sigma B factor antagonist
MNQYTQNNGVLECHFSGRLDTLLSQAIDAELKLKLNPGITEIIFDLSGVEYLSSSFLRICLSSLRLKGKDHFRVINVSPTALKVFQIANLTEILQIS